MGRRFDLEKCWSKGYEARGQGLEESACPYTDATPEANAWLDGWEVRNEELLTKKDKDDE